jgi:cardiolipin synthase A/B
VAEEPQPGVAPSGGTAGNHVRLFDDGALLFQEKSDAISAARERVWIETFLFTPDDTGRATLRLLCDAARRGCDVVLLFDQAGSHVTNLGFYRPLVETGGVVAIFNPLPPWQRYGRRIGSYFKHRDHRKTAVMDDVAFCGGHNFSQSYMGPPPHRFYDMTVKLQGPCVRDLAALFLESLHATRPDETRPLPASPRPLEGGVPVRATGFDARRGAAPLIDDYRTILDDARDEALLIFGYFAPDADLVAPIIAAAKRGVRVKLLTAGASDLPFTRWAGQHTYHALLSAGVRIFQLQDPHLHAKSMAVDGLVCMVGSFDINTFQRRNTRESAVIVEDTRLARDIAIGFASCLQRSREITLHDRQQKWKLARAAEWLSHRALRI